MAQADLQREAERAAQDAVERLLDRSGCRISCALSGEIHQVYAGRFDLRPRAESGYCPNHPKHPQTMRAMCARSLTMCPLCGRHAATVHDDCLDDLDNQLRSIPALYADLAVALRPGRGESERVSGTRTPPLPLRVEPLSLLCRGGIVSILGTWETDWRERCGLPLNSARADREQQLDGGRLLASIVDVLHVLLAWAADTHPAIDEFAAEIGDIISACRMALGVRSNYEAIGRCPAPLGGRTCGRVLLVDPNSKIIRCDRCRTEWPKARWPLLAVEIAKNAA